MGYDVLKGNNFNINFGQSPCQVTPTYILQAQKDYVIPPKSERKISLNPSKAMTSSRRPSVALVKPFKSIYRLGLASCYAVVNVYTADNGIPVKILNPTDIPRTVRKGTKVACIEQLPANSIQDHNAADEQHLRCATASTKTDKKVKIAPTEKFKEMFDFTDSTFTQYQQQQL